MTCGTGCGFSDGGNCVADVRTRSSSIRNLWIAVILCMVFMSVEVVGGIKANSLEILTDAAHLLTDVVGFAISLFVVGASTDSPVDHPDTGSFSYPPDADQVYPYSKVESMKKKHPFAV